MRRAGRIMFACGLVGLTALASLPATSSATLPYPDDVDPDPRMSDEVTLRFRIPGYGPHTDCVVRQTDVDPPVESNATVTRYHESGEPSAIVLLMQLDE